MTALSSLVLGKSQSLSDLGVGLCSVGTVILLVPKGCRRAEWDEESTGTQCRAWPGAWAVSVSRYPALRPPPLSGLLKSVRCIKSQ